MICQAQHERKTQTVAQRAGPTHTRTIEYRLFRMDTLLSTYRRRGGRGSALSRPLCKGLCRGIPNHSGGGAMLGTGCRI